MSTAQIIFIAIAVFAAAFVTGSLVSYLIEGYAYYRESAISGVIIAGLMAWQLQRNNKDAANG